MNKKGLQILEYYKIISMLAEKASSEPGKALCEKLYPSTVLEEIEEAQTETADALSRLFAKGNVSFGSNKDLGFAIKSLEIGSTLSISELLKIANMLENVARVKNYGRPEKDDETSDSLTPYFEILQPLTPLSSEIRRCIVSEEEIADDASPTLKHIRRHTHPIKQYVKRFHAQHASGRSDYYAK